MDQTISSQTLAQAAPLFLEQYPDAQNQWHALAGLIDGADTQDLGSLEEALVDLQGKLEEAETVWQGLSPELPLDDSKTVLEVLEQSAPYGFSILQAALDQIQEVHAQLDRLFSEE